VFLLGSVAAFYHFRRSEFWQAAAWGLLVGLTRPNGCFLALPLAVLAATPQLPRWLAGGSQPTIVRVFPPLAAASAPVVGVLLSAAFSWRLTGQPFAWAVGHAAWGREYSGLSALIAQRYVWLAEGGFYEYTKNVPADFINASASLFVLATAWPVARRLGLAY